MSSSEAESISTLTARTRLPHQNSEQAAGSVSAKVRMPSSSSITFRCPASQRVAKIRFSTRKEGRPW